MCDHLEPPPESLFKAREREGLKSYIVEGLWCPTCGAICMVKTNERDESDVKRPPWRAPEKAGGDAS